MSDPRRRIAQQRDALVAPPISEGQPIVRDMGQMPRRPARVDEATMIGKKQGSLRCVGLYLSAADADHLRSAARTEGVALGVALVQLMNSAFDAVAEDASRPTEALRFPTAARRTTRRGLDRPSIVYVLLDPIEATAVKAAADSLGLSVSDLSGRCISADAAPRDASQARSNIDT